MEHIEHLKSDRLFSVCKRYGVKELYAFGSAVSGEMSDDSDLDFLVVFDRKSPTGAFEQFMGFKNSLEAIFARPVDLLTLKPFRNPVFQVEVNRSKVLLYAA